MKQTKLSAKQAARLVRAAADPDITIARGAALELTMAREKDERALGVILAALRRGPKAALAAAGSWLFFPETDDELGLRLQAAKAGEALLDLAQARPGEWWAEGLAEVVGLVGGRLLTRLTKLAKREPWARAVVAVLPEGTRLAGGQEPQVWLAARRVGRSGAARARALARRGDWPGLAKLSPDHLRVARAAVGVERTAAKGKALAWPGGAQALERLEEIAGLIAAEGAAAYDLASQVSRKLGRMVVLMGNASLGGPPLWAVPGPWSQGMAWPRRTMAQPLAGPVSELARLRARRLAGPGLLRALWDLEATALVAGRGARTVRALRERAAPWLAQERLEELATGQLNLSLGGPSWKPALDRVHQALALAQSLERQATRALGLVYGLANAGRSAITKGKPLVLPWVDKFVASTLKDGDWAYLTGIVELLGSMERPPMLLMIDETVHRPAAAMPGLLAAAMAARPGLRLTGLGALGGTDEPRDLGRAVLDAAGKSHLVVLRPMPGTHPAISLDAALRQGSSAGPLSPASRDGASYLLAGTAPAGLTGYEALGNAPPDWLLTSRGFAPLGSWLRTRVRALASAEGPKAGPWQGYVKACGLG